MISCVGSATELAQLEERSAFNRVVVGSSPTFGDNKKFLLETNLFDFPPSFYTVTRT